MLSQKYPFLNVFFDFSSFLAKCNQLETDKLRMYVVNPMKNWCSPYVP